MADIGQRHSSSNLSVDLHHTPIQHRLAQLPQTVSDSTILKDCLVHIKMSTCNFKINSRPLTTDYWASSANASLVFFKGSNFYKFAAFLDVIIPSNQNVQISKMV